MASAKELPPPVTDAHLQAAFAAMRWYGWGYNAAMRDPVLRRQVECRAAVMRTLEWERTTKRTVIAEKRVKLGADGHPIGWCTQIVPGDRVTDSQRDFFAQPGTTQRTNKPNLGTT